MPQGWEWLLLIAVLLLLFGTRKLPEMARSIGQSARVFKGEMKGLRDDDTRTKDAAPPTAGPPAPPPPAPRPDPSPSPNSSEPRP